MNQIATILPVAVFFTAYVLFDLYFASALLAAALGVQTLHAHATRGRADAMLWVSFVPAGVCAVLAVGFQDTVFLVGRASAMYWPVSVGLALTYWVSGRNAIQMLFEERFDAPPRVWKQWLWLYVGVFALHVISMRSYQLVAQS